MNEERVNSIGTRRTDEQDECHGHPHAGGRIQFPRDTQKRTDSQEIGQDEIADDAGTEENKPQGIGIHLGPLPF